MATKNDPVIVVEIDVETGNVVEREITADEISHQEILFNENEQIKLDAEAAQAAREASIRKMAEASGLTDEEIEALFL